MGLGYSSGAIDGGRLEKLSHLADVSLTAGEAGRFAQQQGQQQTFTRCVHTKEKSSRKKNLKETLNGCQVVSLSKPSVNHARLSDPTGPEEPGLTPALPPAPRTLCRRPTRSTCSCCRRSCPASSTISSSRCQLRQLPRRKRRRRGPWEPSPSSPTTSTPDTSGQPWQSCFWIFLKLDGILNFCLCCRLNREDKVAPAFKEDLLDSSSSYRHRSRSFPPQRQSRKIQQQVSLKKNHSTMISNKTPDLLLFCCFLPSRSLSSLSWSWPVPPPPPPPPHPAITFLSSGTQRGGEGTGSPGHNRGRRPPCSSGQPQPQPQGQRLAISTLG